MLSVKQGDIKYHFLSLWYDETWDWTLISLTIGEHSTYKANPKIHIEDKINLTFLAIKWPTEVDMLLNKTQPQTLALFWSTFWSQDAKYLQWLDSRKQSCISQILKTLLLGKYNEKDGDQPLAWKFKRFTGHNSTFDQYTRPTYIYRCIR